MQLFRALYLRIACDQNGAESVWDERITDRRSLWQMTNRKKKWEANNMEGIADVFQICVEVESLHVILTLVYDKET